MMADAVGEDKEKALVGLALDKSKTHEAQTLWSSIAKKFNGHGLSSISMACGALALYVNQTSQCVLSRIMLNINSFHKYIKPLLFRGFTNEVPRYD